MAGTMNPSSIGTGLLQVTVVAILRDSAAELTATTGPPVTT
jgi:hypothetical protein